MIRRIKVRPSVYSKWITVEKNRCKKDKKSPKTTHKESIQNILENIRLGFREINKRVTNFYCIAFKRPTVWHIEIKLKKKSFLTICIQSEIFKVLNKKHLKQCTHICKWIWPNLGFFKIHLCPSSNICRLPLFDFY